MYVIITRHPATEAFIRAEKSIFADALCISGNATAADVKGKFVAGNIPLHLAAQAISVFAVEFTGNPPRGQEYTHEDMIDAGAYLAEYMVQSL